MYDTEKSLNVARNGRFTGQDVLIRERSTFPKKKPPKTLLSQNRTVEIAYNRASAEVTFIF